jgi:hypothetical protein
MRRGWEMMGDPLRREDTPPDTSEQHRLRLPLRPPRETLSPLRPFNPLLAWDPKGGTRFRLQHVAKGIGEQSSNAPCHLTGLYSAFSNPLLERLGYGMANMRLAQRGQIRPNGSLQR